MRRVFITVHPELRVPRLHRGQYRRCGQWPLAAETLEALADRYPEHPLAGEALARFRSKPTPEAAPAEGLNGDIEVFGLPTLLQSLAGSEAAGRLVVTESNGVDRGLVFFSSGKIVRCEVGRQITAAFIIGGPHM